MSTVRTCKTLASFPLLAGEKGLDKKIDKVMLFDDIRAERNFSSGSFIVGRWTGDNKKRNLVLLTKVFNSGAAGVAFQGNLPPRTCSFVRRAGDSFVSHLFRSRAPRCPFRPPQ